MSEQIETGRMALRPITLDDVDALVELDADPAVMRYLTGRASTRAEVEAAVRAHVGDRWLAIEQGSGAVVGWFGVAPRGPGVVELGYRLAQRWWGRGLATEGARAVIDLAFARLRAQRVVAQTMAVNERSRRVMERCGMRHVRTFHVEFVDPLPGTEHGEVEYELTVHDWRDGRRPSQR